MPNMMEMLGGRRRGANRPLSLLQVGPGAVAQAAPVPQLIDPMSGAQQFNFSGLYQRDTARDQLAAEEDAKLILAEKEAKERAATQQALLDAVQDGQLDPSVLQQYEVAGTPEARRQIASRAFDPLGGIDPAAAAELDISRGKETRLGSEFDQQLALDKALADQEAEQQAAELGITREELELAKTGQAQDEAFRRAELGQAGELAARKIEAKQERDAALREAAQGDPALERALLFGGGKGASDLLSSREKASQPTAKEREVATGARTAFKALNAGLDRLEGLVDTHGAEVATGSARDDMQATQTDIILQAKELFELGALSGPDMGLVESLLVSPTPGVFGGAAAGVRDVFGGESLAKRSKDSIGALRERLKTMTDIKLEGVGAEPLADTRVNPSQMSAEARRARRAELEAKAGR